MIHSHNTEGGREGGRGEEGESVSIGGAVRIIAAHRPTGTALCYGGARSDGH